MACDGFSSGTWQFAIFGCGGDARAAAVSCYERYLAASSVGCAVATFAEFYALGGVRIDSGSVASFDGVAEERVVQELDGVADARKSPHRWCGSCIGSSGGVNDDVVAAVVLGGLSGTAGDVGVDNVVRGKNYLSNKKKRLARKKKRSVVGGTLSGNVVAGEHGRVPLLEGASDEQRKEFVASRLQMMTARNNLLAAKAVDQKKYVDDRAFTRVAERKLELERLEIDAKLKKLEEVNGNDFGFDGCTVASEPSLSTGTVSPNSSISVAEEMRLRRAVAKLQTQLKDTQLVLELERTVGGKEKDELKEKYALAVNANLEKVAGGLVIKTSSTGKEFLGMANELDDDGESYPDIEFSQPSFNGEEVW